MSQGSDTPQNALIAAVDELATPFGTPDDVSAVSMKLDAIAGVVVRSPLVIARIGAGRASKLAATSAELPDVLDEIGGDAFELAARDARELLTTAGSSLIDFGTVPEANAARQRLHTTLSRAVASL
jgi:hypothetical protein